MLERRVDIVFAPARLWLRLPFELPHGLERPAINDDIVVRFLIQRLDLRATNQPPIHRAASSFRRQQ